MTEYVTDIYSTCYLLKELSYASNKLKKVSTYIHVTWIVEQVVVHIRYLYQQTCVNITPNINSPTYYVKQDNHLCQMDKSEQL